MNNVDLLAYKAYTLRVDVVRATTVAGSGHPTSCLSAADIMGVLFFHALQFDLHDPKKRTNDRFILSKGHAAPLLYAVYKELGVVSDEQFMHMRTPQSSLEGHPTPRFEFVDVATGSLGMGLSVGVGMALHAQRTKESFYTYVLLGDGELAEGNVWEAAALAAYYKLARLIALVDVNRFGQRGPTMHEHDVKVLAEKFTAFGWRVLTVDGHDIKELVTCLDDARNNSSDMPVVILATTIKGYGVVRAQDKNGFHGKAFAEKDLPEILAELKKRFYKPEWDQIVPVTSVKISASKKHLIKPESFDVPVYKMGELIVARQAFGDVLARAGKQVNNLVCLDADVSNSTYTITFAQQYPEKFVECFIAEQAMIGAAMGMSALGDQVVVSTFGAFLTRAFDQLRMASISRLSLHVVGTHTGVEVGQDGPSQMGLEDLALFRSLPNSLVLCAADAQSCVKLFELMMNYTGGISYLRLMRGALPVIYDDKILFEIGGFNVLRSSPHDQAIIIAAGVTVHQALSAYEQLKEQNIHVRVVDLYCIKPLDHEQLRACVMNSGARVVSVEDHYVDGGLGDAVSAALVGLSITFKKLAVHVVPPSGKPEQLLSWAGIDAAAITRAVKELF